MACQPPRPRRSTLTYWPSRGPDSPNGYEATPAGVRNRGSLGLPTDQGWWRFDRDHHHLTASARLGGEGPVERTTVLPAGRRGCGQARVAAIVRSSPSAASRSV